MVPFWSLKNTGFFLGTEMRKYFGVKGSGIWKKDFVESGFAEMVESLELKGELRLFGGKKKRALDSEEEVKEIVVFGKELEICLVMK